MNERSGPIGPVSEVNQDVPVYSSSSETVIKYNPKYSQKSRISDTGSGAAEVNELTNQVVSSKPTSPGASVVPQVLDLNSVASIPGPQHLPFPSIPLPHISYSRTWPFLPPLTGPLPLASQSGIDVWTSGATPMPTATSSSPTSNQYEPIQSSNPPRPIVTTPTPKPPTSRAKPNCAKCKNHLEYHRLKGHKRNCKYIICPCKKCLSTGQHRAEMALQTFQKREKALEKKRSRLNGLESTNSPPQAQYPAENTAERIVTAASDPQNQVTNTPSSPALQRSTTTSFAMGRSEEFCFDHVRQMAYNCIAQNEHGQRWSMLDYVQPKTLPFFCYPPPPVFPTNGLYSTEAFPLGFCCYSTSHAWRSPDTTLYTSPPTLPHGFPTCVPYDLPSSADVSSCTSEENRPAIVNCGYSKYDHKSGSPTNLHSDERASVFTKTENSNCDK